MFREGPQREAVGVENEHQTPWAIGKTWDLFPSLPVPGAVTLSNCLNFLGLFFLILQVRDSCFITFFILSSFDI